MSSIYQRLTLAVALAGFQIAGGGLASAQIANGSFEAGGGSFTSWNRAGDTLIQTSSLGTGPTDGTHDALLASATDGSVNASVPPGTGVGSAALETLLGVSSGTLLSVGNGTPVLGSAVSQTISLAAGQTVFFDWDFLTNQVYNDGTSDSYAPLASNNDFGFFTVAPVGSPSLRQISKLADTFYGYVNNPNAPGGFVTGFAITPATNPFISETGFHTFSWTATTDGNYIFGAGALHVTTGADDGINSALLVDHFIVTPEPGTCLVLGALSLGLLRRKRKQR